MTKILKFPTKAAVPEITTPALKSSIYRGIRLDSDRSTDPFFLAGIEFINAHDFRGSFDKYPEVPASGFMTKTEVHNTVVDVHDLAKAAVIAMDIIRDDEASKELCDLYVNLLGRKVTKLTLGYLPSHLIGFVMFLGESLRTTGARGQHPASPIFGKYGWHTSCVASTIHFK